MYTFDFSGSNRTGKIRTPPLSTRRAAEDGTGTTTAAKKQSRRKKAAPKKPKTDRHP